MKRLKRAAILLSLIENLESRGSWCGETHIQKSVYVLKELFQVELGIDFVLYKHGPYCFELTDELSQLRAEGFLELTPQAHYGPKLRPNTDGWKRLKQVYPQTLARYQKAIIATATWLGDKGVADLERLATALLVTRKSGGARGVDERAEALHKVKPHIAIKDASEAMREVDRKISARVTT